MKRIGLSISALLMVMMAFAQIPQKAAIDKIFADWDRKDTPGCALGIMQDGALIYARGYGMANLEYDIPNSSKSVFRIASTSKQFTAACIVLLAQQDKLSLDQTLDTFFPDFPAYAKKINVRHLLNHTSGIRDYLTVASLKGLGEDDYYTDKDIMRWLVHQQELNFAPGEEFLYSNSGYWLLGQIVQKVSGESMADFAKKEIFDPLGMDNTHFHNDHTRVVKNRASGYMPNGMGGFNISMTTLNMIGDGGIFTTVEDIKKWDDAFYESKVLNQEFWNTMTQPGVLNNGEELDYAAGLGVGTHNGLKLIDHGGAFVGFRAELMRFPEQKFSIVIFTNRGDANPTAMAFEIADLFLSDQYQAAEPSTGAVAEIANAEAALVALSEEDLRAFEGDYWNEAGAYSRKIYQKNGKLYYQRSSVANETELGPIGKNTFKMLGTPAEVIVKFNKTKEGEAKMTLNINGGEDIVSKAYTPVQYSAEDLTPFTGNYYSSELDVNYELRLENGLLQLYVNEEQMGPFSPIMNNMLSHRAGVFEFEQKNEKTQGFSLAAGRVKNLYFSKQD